MDSNVFDDIKKRINLVEIIKEDYPLRGSGNEYRGDRDGTHGLVVTRGKGGQFYYYWNKHSRGGSVFDYLINERGMDMKSAVEYAAKRAGVTLPEWTHKDTKAWMAARVVEDAFSVAAKVFEKWMSATAAAMDYGRGRAWTDETIKNARLGFTGFGSLAEYKEMRETLAMNNIAADAPAAVAIMGYRGDVAKLRDKWESELGLKDVISNDDVLKGYISGFMSKPRLIYPHVYFHKVTYLSARNLAKTEDGKLTSEPDKAKKSYNPRKGLVGERQPYFAWNYSAKANHIVDVEGQADAITFAQWGFNVLARAGTALDDYWGKELRERHETRYCALDNDEAGEEAWRGTNDEYPIVDLWGPLTQIVKYPATRGGKIKDANELRQYYASTGVSEDSQAKRMRIRLNIAPVVALVAGKEAAAKQKRRDISAEDKIGAMMRAYEIIAKMGKKKANQMLGDFIKAMGISTSAFNKGLKDALGERDEKTTDESKPEKTAFIYGGWFPVEEGSNKGWLVDYLWNPDMKKAMFAYRDPEGRIGKDWKLDIKGTRYYPKVDPNIEMGGVLFASDLGVEKSTRDLLKYNDDYMRRSFLLDNPLEYKLAAYYAQFTWLYDCFDELSYFRAQGESDSGKSAITMRVGYVCYRLTKSSGVGSAASFKHMSHMYRGTMFFDEIKDDMDEFDDRVVMLNIGAMKEQAYVPMMTSFKNSDGTVEFEVVNFNVYGPKMCTMYGKFPQVATEGRFLTVKTIKHELAELKKHNVPRRWSDEMRAMALHKRNMDMTWRLKNWQPRLQPPDSLEDERVSTRVNQVTVPIKYILTMNPSEEESAEKALEEINLVIKNLYEEQKFEVSQKTEARIIEAIDAVQRDPAFMLLDFVQGTELDEWGSVKYIRYSDLTKVVNYLIDEMNLGTGKSPSDVIKKDDDADDEPASGGAKKKGKKKFASNGVTASTIGTKCRNLRLPVHRLGRGFVVIIYSGARPDEVQNRLELLKVRFGVNEIKIDTTKKEDEIKSVAQKEKEKALVNQPVSVQPGFDDPPVPEFPENWDEYANE